MTKYRMIHVDHYMCRPISPFDDLRSELNGKNISKVPVIRIFGADSSGRKICIHVHGFYPYIAIKNHDANDLDLKRKLVSDIERGLESIVADKKAQGGRSNNDDAKAGPSIVVQTDAPIHDEDLALRLGQERLKPKFLTNDQKFPIHKVDCIESFNYYGYHHEQEKFFKIYLYNPRMVKMIAQLFEDCKVFTRFVPVFWAHLPYILLFFIDNNLRGMQFIELDQVYWRRGSAPTSQKSETSMADENSSNSPTISMEQFTTDIEPLTTCELEADVRYEWIGNRKRYGSNGNDTALRELWLDDQEATQISSQDKNQLPLFELEKNYIIQLCESYGVDHDILDLKITPKPNISKPLDVVYHSESDDSSDFLFHPEPSQPVSPILSPDHTRREQSTPTAPVAKKMRGPEVSQEELLRSKINLDLRRNSMQEQASSGDEFSDDDQFLLEAIMQAESAGNITAGPKNKKKGKNYSDNSMIDGRSVLSSAASDNGTQHSSSSTRDTVSHEYQFLSLMSMELHASTRGDLRPDPQFDPIEAIFYCIRNDTPLESDKQVQGLLITDPFRSLESPVQSPNDSIISKSSLRSMNMSLAQKMRTLMHKTGLTLSDVELRIVDSELELVTSLIDIVKKYDPEILFGYEMEQLSWGYVLERSTMLNINVALPLSRVVDDSLGNNSKYVESSFVQPIVFTGRLVFSIWRVIKHEIKLNTCSYERIHMHALNERVPCFTFHVLTEWFNENRNRWRVIDYYFVRVVGQIRILEKFDLIAKVSELARVYGTQFVDVITRGSQIGIESMMLRLAKLQNLSPLSPTVLQRNKMKAPEALPLVMEPETNIYYDPVAVLDFQSLYPSIVIAYNYCYSTCLGRVSDLEKKERHAFGCSQLFVDPAEVKRLLDMNSVTVSPCGVAFVKKNVRHGILPKMLNELIVTRAMVKDQMKKNMAQERPNRRLQRILDHRQHGLKMMANTTYGYAGASYTGRMPCIEIADSIVSKGRETLEKAIELVESRAEWAAKVIYGDTDSIFIQFKDCDRDTAFKRSFEMVAAISEMNPHPIKMKFEKIYQPCVLQTKKRYCGFKYESPKQTRPEFEAKGIETIRRDCCPAAARMLEMALRIQFTTRDINQVKRYAQHQFVKIMSGKLSNLQDFIFARQYKPRSLDKQESVFVPAWQIAKRMLAIDPRAEPRLGERVPFLIIYGEPGTPLVNLTKTPIELLENLSFRINADYYIQKIICPTLNRIFCTMKVDTLSWYKSMPHKQIVHRSHYLAAQKSERNAGLARQSTMSQYFSPSHCPVCAKSIPMSDDICENCRDDIQSSVTRLAEEISRNQKKLFISHQLCRACSSLERDQLEHSNPCISYDCQNLFRFHQAKLDALNSNFLADILKNLN